MTKCQKNLVLLDEYNCQSGSFDVNHYGDENVVDICNNDDNNSFHKTIKNRSKKAGTVASMMIIIIMIIMTVMFTIVINYQERNAQLSTIILPS